MIGQKLSRRQTPVWRYFFLGLLAVVVFLGGVNVAILVIQAADQPAAVSSGELIYITTFDDYNKQWDQFPGQISAQIVDGALRLSSDGIGQGGFSTLDRIVTRFDLQVEARWVNTTSQGDQIVLLFGYQNAQNYYALTVRADGAYRVERHLEGQPLDIVSEWQIAPVVRKGPGQANRLRVIADKGAFEFFVNGQPLPMCLKGENRRSTWQGLNSGQCLSNGGQTTPNYPDNTFTQGQIALGIIASQPGLKVDFDNIIIMGPQ